MAKKNTTTKKQQAAPAAETKVRKAPLSFNTIEFSGSICRGSIKKTGSITRFLIKHNMGPKAKPVFAAVVLMPKNGKKELAFDQSLIEEHKNVVVKGYLRSGNYDYTPKGEQEAKTFYRDNELVALELRDNPVPVQA